MENKKGIALNQAFGAVLTLVLIGVLVIVGIFIFVNLGASFVNLETLNIVNETSATIVNSTQSFAVVESTIRNTSLCNYASFAISAVNIRNATGTFDIAPGNFTVHANNGSYTPITALETEFNNTFWNVTYSANTGGRACEANDELITQFGTYPVLVGLVGTIIFLGLVIGVLVASFVFGGRRNGV